MPKLGLCVSPFLGLSLSRLAEFAHEAEDAGIQGIFIPEGRNDGLMCCYAAARATRRIIIATWITNIFLREPSLCGWAVRGIVEESAGWFILGLGVSHRPLLENLGIRVREPRERLHQYTQELRKQFEGQGTSPSLAGAVPIYFAALSLETLRLGAERADGLMLDICTVERLKAAVDAAKRTLSWAGRSREHFTITTGVPLFLHPERGKALAEAQRMVARYASLRAYNRMFARSGYAAEMAQVLTVGDREAAFALITQAMVESVALIGATTEWPERFEKLGQAGADWIIVRPFAVDED